MTIDERIEALTQSLELLGHLHQELEKETAARFADTNAKFAETNAKFAETLQFINRLAHVAEAHEQRLDDLEGN
jgi:hypothetical protein